MSSDSDRSDVNDLFAGSGDDSKYVTNVSDFIFIRFFLSYVLPLLLLLLFFGKRRGNIIALLELYFALQQ